MQLFILPVKSCHLSSVLLQPPQFVDIPLEEDDSSDEEYQPDDEDEDETAEEVNATCTKICSVHHGVVCMSEAVEGSLYFNT